MKSGIEAKLKKTETHTMQIEIETSDLRAIFAGVGKRMFRPAVVLAEQDTVTMSPIKFQSPVITELIVNDQRRLRAKFLQDRQKTAVPRFLSC